MSTEKEDINTQEVEGADQKAGGLSKAQKKKAKAKAKADDPKA